MARENNKKVIIVGGIVGVFTLILGIIIGMSLGSGTNGSSSSEELSSDDKNMVGLWRESNGGHFELKADHYVDESNADSNYEQMWIVADGQLGIRSVSRKKCDSNNQYTYSYYTIIRNGYEPVEDKIAVKCDDDGFFYSYRENEYGNPVYIEDYISDNSKNIDDFYKLNIHYYFNMYTIINDNTIMTADGTMYYKIK